LGQPAPNILSYNRAWMWCLFANAAHRPEITSDLRMRGNSDAEATSGRVSVRASRKNLLFSDERNF